MRSSRIFRVNRGFATILVLGLIVSVIALSTTLYLKQKPTTSQEIDTQVSPTPQSSPADEITHWKTYT